MTPTRLPRRLLLIKSPILNRQNIFFQYREFCRFPTLFLASTTAKDDILGIHSPDSLLELQKPDAKTELQKPPSMKAKTVSDSSSSVSDTVLGSVSDAPPPARPSIDFNLIEKYKNLNCTRPCVAYF